MAGSGCGLETMQKVQVPETVELVCAIDENYAMPLATMVRSVLENLNPTWQLRVHVITTNLKASTQTRLRSSWPQERLSVHFMNVDPESLDGLKVSRHISVAAYLRLRASTLLPADLSKVIYLDADLIVESDLSVLWCWEMSGHPLLAVRDMLFPCMDTAVALPEAKYLGTIAALPTYRRLGLVPDEKYFNSGVMVIDLVRWREERAEDRLFQYLREAGQQVNFWDQDALNAIFARRWLELPPEWNYQLWSADRYPEGATSLFSKQEFEQARLAPRVIHFVGHLKPWLIESPPKLCHPRFFHYLDQTLWRGYRPWLDPRQVLQATTAKLKSGARRLLRFVRGW